MEDSGALRGFDWEGAKDITALSEGTSGRCCGRLHGRKGP
jgi:hypothetical protein